MQHPGRATPILACLFLTACPAEKKDAPAAQTSAPAPAAAASQPTGAAGADPAVPQGEPFSGEIRLGDGVGPDAIKPTDVLFIVARQGVAGQPGQIVATQRHAPVSLPMKFSVAPTDVMVPGTPFTGPFVVTARLDRDGDAMTKTEDDLYATAAGEVRPGATTVSLVLAKGMPPAPAGAPGAAGGAAPPGHPGAAPGSQPAH